MSSTLLTESTRRLVHMQRAVSPLFVLLVPAVFERRLDDVFPRSSANSAPSNPSVVSFVWGASYVSCQLRKLVFPKLACRMNCCRARAVFFCFLMIGVSGIVAARMCESVHGTARREARRLTVWCGLPTRRRSLDLRVVATNMLFSPYT